MRFKLYVCRKNTCVSSERGSRADSLNDIQMYQVGTLSMLIPMEMLETYDVAKYFLISSQHLALFFFNDDFIENV